MKPTQAQIEAAAKVLKPFFAVGMDAETLAMAALTAAAQVGEQNPINVYNSVYQEAIERCAQVAERCPIDWGTFKVAAAIRKLKNEV